MAKTLGPCTHALGPCTHTGDPEEAPGSWLRIGSALAIAATWGVNQQMDELSVSAPLSISDIAIQINKSFFKKNYAAIFLFKVE